jgi:hypothetical protein
MTELRVIVDLEDSPETSANIQATAQPGNGIVVAPVAPAGRRPASLLVDIARAIGKQTMYGIPRASLERKTAMLAAWLRAQQTERLRISRAHLLDADGWQYACDLARLANTDLDLIVQGTQPTRAQQVWCDNNGIAPERFEHTDLAEQRLAPPIPSEAAKEKDFPEVPETHFLTFIEDSRELLHPDDLPVVEASYEEACEAAAEALAGGDPWTMQRWVPALLGRLIRNHCRNEAAVRLRAAQATFFTHGWRLRVDDARFAALLAEYQPSPLDNETLALLCGYLDPQPAAAAAARILVGHHARLLTLNDVAADATTIRTPDEAITVPEAARVLLLAQLELRRSEGADSIAPLINIPDHLRAGYADRHLNEDQWRDLLQNVELDTGLTGLSPRDPLRPDPRWNRRSGFSLMALNQPLTQRKAA